MPQIKRLAFIGNSLPRRCGIATFTNDLHQAVAAAAPTLDTCIVAMTDHGQTYDYPAEVTYQIAAENLDDYVAAADFLNARGTDAISLQHEFGIFGGEAGSHILALLTRLTVPVVTTLHTVLAHPTPQQRSVLEQIVALSSRIVVMAEKGREMLRTVYRVPSQKIDVLPHGIPDFDFLEPDAAKAAHGFADRPVILTFGLLSPNKGIEVMIDAMPAILERCPDAIYVVLGATHPNLVRNEGEAYRERLMARVQALDIGPNVVFLDQFVDRATLLGFISMCDVYVTPYLNEAQMTSGTLAYSFGLGKAVVSTPYWHARELLADGQGAIVPFNDAAALSREIGDLLTDHGRRLTMRQRAYASSRSMIWEQTATRYLDLFDKAHLGHRLQVITRLDQRLPLRGSQTPPDIQLGHLYSMCDGTGLFQHAVHSVPDRSHGYCIDDNARALLLACALGELGEGQIHEALMATFAAFIQHGWNPDTRRFRNFMSFDRRWLEETGSEDSHGRTLWALGECARSDRSATRRAWAAGLFTQALAPVEHFQSPRAWAFTLLGLNAYCQAHPGDTQPDRIRLLLARRLMTCLAGTETPDWIWFEEGLAYDNARLPQALLATGLSLNEKPFIQEGMRSLRWLMTLQTTPAWHFRPVGTDSFGDRQTLPHAFDQQPLEATATIAACLAAWRIVGDPEWRTHATRAFAWFMGANDLSVPLVDLDTGSCRDGLHPDRPNENMGGESVVSYLLGLAETRLAAQFGADRSIFVSRRA
jgi:glycosyltransferase involved in cell wall biosynthesis